MHSPEHRVRLIAQRQRGVITRRQVLATGFTEDRLRHRVASGAWRRLDRGVYLVFGDATPHRLLAAAVFALPAVVSHASAAQLHGLEGPHYPTPEVTVPHRMSNRFAGVSVHESTDLDPEHIVEVDGLPVTSVARTIFDVAIRLRKLRLRRMVDDAFVRRLATPSDLRTMLGMLGRRGRPGTAAIRALVQDLEERYVAPESELERRLLEVLEQAGLPPPEQQMRLPWRSPVAGRIDAAYPSARLIIECDGRRWHTLAESFERDRRRDNLAQLAGWTVLRFTWEDVTRRPLETVQQIRHALRSAA